MSMVHVLIVIGVFVLLVGIVWYVSRKTHSQNSDALEHIRTMAQSGDVYSQFKLAGMYYDGSGVPRDEKEALRWYEKAAEQDHAEAQFIMGILCERGEGRARDDQRAFYWFSRAAGQGHPRAEIMLEAEKWDTFRKEVSPERAPVHDEQQANGGDIIRTENIDEYLHKASTGDVDAQYNLGILYYHGEGIPKNYEEALKWFLLAAEQDDADAQYNLGFMFGRGEGVPKDRDKSMTWFKRAAQQGHESAKEVLEKMLRNP
ncbi:MAG TPA: sel1 repeat family protein [Deltaproteobacteria bacterium]|nr:sel1 repeat family protein [Deltaproteobacteria bacterium]